MKASELIKKLEQEIEKHGDLPVHYDDGLTHAQDVRHVESYTERGNSPTDSHPAVEIFLH